MASKPAGGGGQKMAAGRVEDDRVARLPVGANLVEVEEDGARKYCTHEVAWPPGQEGSLLPPPKRDGPPAREYPFKIDPFQQTAVNALEAGTLTWEGRGGAMHGGSAHMPVPAQLLHCFMQCVRAHVQHSVH